MKQAEAKRDADMLDEYDFTDGERGKYAARYAVGVTVKVKPARPRKAGALVASTSAPRFPLEDRKLGRSSSHYTEVTS